MLRRLFLITTLIFTIIVFSQSVKGSEVYSDGRLDPDFLYEGRVVGTDWAVYAIAPLSDGKVLIGGDFTMYNNIEISRLGRINIDGSLDTTFNVGGTGPDEGIMSIAVQNDGKILIGGWFSSYNGQAIMGMARLNSDGSLDTTFNIGVGIGPVYRGPDVIKIQDDGKILIGGRFQTYNGITKKWIARLNSDGSLDNGFNTVGLGLNERVSDIEILSNGKILIVGSFTLYNGVSTPRIARLNSDGSLDAAFNLGGVGPQFSNPNQGCYLQTVAIQSDNNIMVGGLFDSWNGLAINALTRLNSDGSLDLTFIPRISITTSSIESLEIQGDGKILIGGDVLEYDDTVINNIARINIDGSLDAAFNIGLGLNSSVIKLALDTNNKIHIGGYFTQYDVVQINGYVRLNPDGSFDDLLGQGLGINNTIRGTTVYDKKILIGGAFTSNNGAPIHRIARMNMYGSLDDTFNSSVGANSTVYGFIPLDDGKIIIGGGFTTYNGVSRSMIARLNNDGSLDETFDPGVGANNSILSILVQSDGKIIIMGYFTSYNLVARNRIARLNSDGTLDTTFNPGTGPNTIISTIALQNDGKILIGGAFTSYNGVARNRIARLNNDGSLDETFDPGVGANNSVSAILLSDNKILIGGGFTSYNGIAINRIARLNSDGSIDSSFNPGTGANSSIITIAMQDDERILIGGYFTVYNGTEINRIARLSTNGLLDETFDVGLGANKTVYTITVQDDQKIILGGDFHTFDGQDKAFLTRLGLPDVEAPTGSISINSGAVYTTNTNVTLTLNAIDTYSGLKEMMVCSNSSFEGCGWESYTGSKSWVLDSTLGTKTVYVKYKDNEDNVSEVYSDSIELYNLVVKITDIGLIDDVPDREDLYYYFTSQRVVISGETESNSTIYFTYDNETYTTTSDLQGEYSITLWVDMGTVSISYYAEDESGNESPARALILIVGTEYFPDWLLERLGLLPETGEEEEIEEGIGEEIVDEEEKLEIIKDTITPTPEQDASVLRSNNSDVEGVCLVLVIGMSIIVLTVVIIKKRGNKGKNVAA